MHGIYSFGVCLKNILENRDLSILDASRLFCMKSPTSLSRILHDEVNIKTLERFYQRLIHDPQIALTEEEGTQLKEAIKLQRLGTDEYLAHQALWQLLLPNQEEKAPEIEIISYQASSACRFDTLPQLFSYYRSCASVHMMLSGCCYSSFTSALADMLSALPAPAPITITHCLRSRAGQARSMAAALAAIKPLLPLANYAPFLADRNQLPPEAMALYGKNEFLCALEDSRGKRRWHHGVLLSSQQLLLAEYKSEEHFAFHLHQLTRYAAKLSPIKPRFSSASRPESYVDYIQFFQNLEYDREIFAIKPDLPFHFIHPDLLLSAVYDALPKSPFASNQDMEAMMEQMYAIQLQRWNNIFAKKKVTHMIFSFQTMLEFARTGVQTDHFFAMRPFTPSERRSILGHIRQQMLENPYFNIYFGSEETLSFQLEICGYDYAAILLSSATTSYNLSKEYMDAVISQPDFCQTYRTFFLSEFLPARVYPPKDTLQMMDQVIAAIPDE